MRETSGRASRPLARWPMFHRVILTVGLALAVSFVLNLFTDRLEVRVLAYLGLLAAVVFLLRGVFEPLSRLERTMIRAEHGEYLPGDDQVEEAVVSDLGHLGRAVNVVVNRLARNRQYLSSRIIRALEEERKRIARELHDETSQSLTTIVLNLDMAGKALDAGGIEKARSIMRQTRSLTVLTLEEIRKLIFDLRPTILDDLGLVPAVRWYAMNKMEPIGMEVSFEVQGFDRRLSPDMETAVFRVVQEALNNVIKHAEASRVDITLKCNEDMVLAKVSDDGRGFDVEAALNATPVDKRGLGLFSMGERVKLLEGQFHVDSQPQRGTTVKVVIPRSYKRSQAQEVREGAGEVT